MLAFSHTLIHISFFGAVNAFFPKVDGFQKETGSEVKGNQKTHLYSALYLLPTRRLDSGLGTSRGVAVISGYW